MQLQTGVQRAQLHIPVVHPMTLLDEAYTAATPSRDTPDGS
jgi:hypothetical protein